MKIYLAGTLGVVERERQLIEFYQHRLLSFWDIQQEQFAVKDSFHYIKEQNENLVCRSAGRRKAGGL